MAITPCGVETDVISQLPDKPVTDGGLTSAQFKAKFDQVGLAIKNYINNTLIPNITNQFQPKISSSNTLNGGLLTDASIAADKLADLIITAQKIANETITASQIANSTIPESKLDTTTLDYETVNLNANQVRPIFVTDTAPTSSSADGIYLVYEE